MMIGPLLTRRKFNPARLFAGGEAGAFYDPSDLSSMYQDSAGTTAAVVGQPVGLLLDKKFGLARGSELLSTGAPLLTGSATAATYNTATGAGTIHRVDASNRSDVRFAATSATYVIDIENTGAAQFSVRTNNATVVVANVDGGQRLSIYVAATTNIDVVLNVNATSTTFTVHSLRLVNGNHATQSTTAAKPILRQDSNGKYYLEFDGVDDVLTSTFTIAQPIDRISAIRQITWTAGDRIFGSPSTSAPSIDAAEMAQPSTGASPQIVLYSGVVSIQTSAAAVGSNYVMTERHSGASSRLAVNNGAYATGDAGSNSPTGIAIAARGGPANFGNIRFYGVLMIGRSLTDGETSQVRNFMASRAAVTL